MHIKRTQPTAVIFLRDSGHEERSACKQSAKALGAEVIREYSEYGGTPSIDKRPVLRRMLDELLALHDADYVIVTNPDRLARKAHDWSTILLEVEVAGAELITATSVMQMKDREGAMV